MSDDKNAALNMAMLAGGMYGPNPYSQFPNGIQSTSYAGTPTDALGKPIQAQPGMTLNQTPAQPQAAAPSSSGVNFGPLTGLNYRGADGSLQTYGGAGAQPGSYVMTNPGGIGGGNAHNYDQMAGQNIPAQYQYMPAQQSGAGAASAPAAPQGGTPANSYQNALQLLSNPGHVTTPGATVPQSSPVSQQPSVLTQFLANGQPQGPGAGGYSNQGFFDTLNKLKNMGTGGTASS